MSETFRVACVQNCAERDMAPSIAALEPLIRGAAKDGARLIVLPEMATMLEPQNAKVLEKVVSESSDPGLKRFRELAKETGAWILVGSLLVIVAWPFILRWFGLNSSAAVLATIAQYVGVEVIPGLAARLGWVTVARLGFMFARDGCRQRVRSF